MIRFAGLRAIEIGTEPARLVLRLPLRDELKRAADHDQFHGGAIAMLIDTAADFAVALVAGGGVPTANFRTDFLRPCAGTHVDAHAVVRRAGRTLAIADVDVIDARDRLCAVGRGTYMNMVG